MQSAASSRDSSRVQADEELLPPRWARWSVAAACPRADRQALLDDLQEEFAELAATEGQQAARAWYRRQVRASVRPLAVRRVILLTPRFRTGPISMLAHDVRSALRSLSHNPGYSAIVVAVLAFGIGANTAIFSLVEPFLFRPLPYPEADRLVHMYETYPQMGSLGWDQQRQSLPTIRDWQQQSTAFEQIGGYLYGDTALRIEGQEPVRMSTGFVTANLFPLLEATPVLGRSFSADEDRPGNNNVVVIASSVWQARFGGDPDIVGRAVIIDGREHVIVGVMPDGFNFPFGSVRMWKPAAFDPATYDRERRAILTLGRLREGADVASATAELSTIQDRLRDRYPDAYEGYGVRVVPLKQALIFFYDMFTGLMLALMLAVGLVLLIVCANVANLTLSRALNRQREVAIRAALGAGRGRLIRQLVAESVILSSLGAIIGAALGTAGIGAVSALVPAELYRVGTIQVDFSALIYTAAVALLAAILFGLAPAVRATRLDLTAALKEWSPTSGGGSARRLSSGLVFGQVLLATFLCGTAILSGNALLAMGAFELGLEPRGVVTVETSLSRAEYPSGVDVRSFFGQLKDRAESLPGIDSAALIRSLPMNFESSAAWLQIPGAEPVSPAQRDMASLHVVSPDYFATMGIPLRTGRSFAATDDADSSPVVIVNEQLAGRLWPTGSAIGETLIADWGRGDTEATVVGVVGGSVGGFFMNGIEDQLFVPFSHATSYRAFLVARHSGDAATIGAAIRGQIAELDRNLPIDAVRSMEAVFDGAVQPVRVVSRLLSAFSAFALLLAAIGVYGVVAYAVSNRRHEIGVRMALGARRSDVVRLVVRTGGRLAVVAALIGGGLTYVAESALASVVDGHASGVAAALVVLLLVGVALVACWLPARRATRIDPVSALRAE